ncbi:hypothetical protein Fmac_010754 [Flemingia macrophylla]|uniref:NADH-plastoquinone oxidoreductase subunit 5 n=1 Tax=Flemingia macrophylla TaxID=520843 RepID=A0ABD1MKJ0_9FABA
MTLGVPNLENIFLFKNLITTFASTVLVGLAFTHLDTYSTASTIYSLENEIGRGPIKSIPQQSNILISCIF